MVSENWFLLYARADPRSSLLSRLFAFPLVDDSSSRRISFQGNETRKNNEPMKRKKHTRNESIEPAEAEERPKILFLFLLESCVERRGMDAS